MRLELELQYADSHPDQVERVGKVDLDQAVKIIQSYPWDREFDKIEERTREDLTSTVPSISLRNQENEILTVSARDKENFIIQFLTSTHEGELILSNNAFDNEYGLTISDIVSKFFEGTMKDSIELEPLPTVEKDVTKILEFRKDPIFFLGLTATILTLILVLGLWSNGFTAKALPAVYFVGSLTLFWGLSATLIIHYTLTDWGKVITFGPDGELTITQKDNAVKLFKKDIDHIVIVENVRHKTLRRYKYARIRTKDQKSFIVTSFVIDPMDLINRLGVNHKEESVFVPLVRYDILTEKQKERIRRNKEKEKIKFIENFKDYEDSKLLQIIGDKKNYADYAVDAATEILERRKKILYPQSVLTERKLKRK